MYMYAYIYLGSIPECVGDLQFLTKLSLAGNELTGKDLSFRLIQYTGICITYIPMYNYAFVLRSYPLGYRQTGSLDRVVASKE